MAVLLLGEGNFTFASAASTMIGRRDPRWWEFLELEQQTNEASCPSLWCTSYDDREYVVKTYPECATLLEKLEKKGVEIRHNVNAWDVATYPKAASRWSRIVWNHPHVGREDCKIHGMVLSHFFNACREVLEDRGKILITLISGQAQRWDLKGQARKQGLALRSVRRFNESDFEGYEAKRNYAKGFKGTKTQAQALTSTSGCSLESYIFTFARSTEEAIFGVDYKEPAGIEDEALDLTTFGECVSAPEKMFSCEVCGKKFGSEQGVQTHHHMVHELGGEKTQSYPCETCDRVFSSERALLYHTIEVHDRVDVKQTQTKANCEEERAEVKCDICDEVLPQGSMERHHETLMPTSSQFRCECGKVFLRERALGQHMNHCLREISGLKRTLE